MGNERRQEALVIALFALNRRWLCRVDVLKHLDRGACNAV
jgi:hypothetical protein